MTPACSDGAATGLAGGPAVDCAGPPCAVAVTGVEGWTARSGTRLPVRRGVGVSRTTAAGGGPESCAAGGGAAGRGVSSTRSDVSSERCAAGLAAGTKGVGTGAAALSAGLEPDGRADAGVVCRSGTAVRE
jgi:hypothetical protein